MIIALFPNETKKQSFEIAIEVANFLKDQGITVVAEDAKSAQMGAFPLSKIEQKKIQFLISMGGDGTLMQIAHRYSHLNAPLVGINLGSLGFMADIPIQEIFEGLSEILEGKYSVEERLILEAKGTPKTITAVNDIVLHRAHNYSLIELAISIEGVYVNTFVADGVIIATPTGSTAYNLAAGGPILTPLLEALVITPICPHTISNRPIVISSDQKIEISYLSPYDAIDVRSDGIDAFSLNPKESVTIQKSKSRFRLVNLDRKDYFATLRTKLGWSGKLR